MLFSGLACAKDAHSPVLTYKNTTTPILPNSLYTDTFSDSDIEQINWMYPCPNSNYKMPQETYEEIDVEIPIVIDQALGMNLTV